MKCKVEILKLGAGPNGVRLPGAVVIMPDAEAKTLEKAGAGKIVGKVPEPELKQEPKVETADNPPKAEKATVARGRKAKGD